jgi:hypothetical protein
MVADLLTVVVQGLVMTLGLLKVGMAPLVQPQEAEAVEVVYQGRVALALVVDPTWVWGLVGLAMIRLLVTMDHLVQEAAAVEDKPTEAILILPVMVLMRAVVSTKIQLPVVLMAVAWVVGIMVELAVVEAPGLAQVMGRREGYFDHNIKLETKVYRPMFLILIVLLHSFLSCHVIDIYEQIKGSTIS